MSICDTVILNHNCIQIKNHELQIKYYTLRDVGVVRWVKLLTVHGYRYPLPRMSEKVFSLYFFANWWFPSNLVTSRWYPANELCSDAFKVRCLATRPVDIPAVSDHGKFGARPRRGAVARWEVVFARDDEIDDIILSSSPSSQSSTFNQHPLSSCRSWTLSDPRTSRTGGAVWPRTHPSGVCLFIRSVVWFKTYWLFVCFRWIQFLAVVCLKICLLEDRHFWWI